MQFLLCAVFFIIFLTFSAFKSMLKTHLFSHSYFTDLFP